LQVDDSATSFTASATTGDPGETSVTPSTEEGTFSHGIATLGPATYDPGANPPDEDQVNLTVTDNHGNSATEHFIFSGSTPGASLVGTSGNDVIFATGNSDTLTGGGGQDQFVFKETTDSTPVQHTITDFNVNLDTIDLRQFGQINNWTQVAETQQGADTLLTLDDHTTVLLKNVLATTLHQGDFIVHGGGFGA
jgi:Ca2+-binding RTX toxin-like protein